MKHIPKTNEEMNKFFDKLKKKIKSAKTLTILKKQIDQTTGNIFAESVFPNNQMKRITKNEGHIFSVIVIVLVYIM